MARISYLQLAGARFSEQDAIFLPVNGRGMAPLLFAISFGSEGAHDIGQDGSLERRQGVEIIHGDG